MPTALPASVVFAQMAMAFMAFSGISL